MEWITTKVVVFKPLGLWIWSCMWLWGSFDVSKVITLKYKINVRVGNAEKNCANLAKMSHNLPYFWNLNSKPTLKFLLENIWKILERESIRSFFPYFTKYAKNEPFGSIFQKTSKAKILPLLVGLFKILFSIVPLMIKRPKLKYFCNS